MSDLGVFKDLKYTGRVVRNPHLLQLFRRVLKLRKFGCEAPEMFRETSSDFPSSLGGGEIMTEFDFLYGLILQ